MFLKRNKNLKKNRKKNNFSQQTSKGISQKILILHKPIIDFIRPLNLKWFSPKFFILGMSLTLLVIVFGTFIYNRFPVFANQHTENNTSPNNTKSSPTEIIGQDQIADDLAIGGSSYAGEIVSKIDVNVYSAREGVITNLSVGIGDEVWQGQAIGQISFPIEFEQLATTAEKNGEVAAARGNLDAVNSQISEVQNRLNSRKSAAEAAKNATISNANNSASAGTITTQEKDELIKEAESEYSEVVTDADNEISDLTKEKRQSEKEIQVAEGVSKTVSGGLDRNIYAVRGGIISGLFKNVGDSVEISDQIAAIGISNPTIDDRCVRFRIPGNQPLPKKGDTVTISRPGFPLDTETGTITGVGTAIDDNGHFVAEATFENIVDWAVHTQVRVKTDMQSSNQIYIPLSAVWFDKEGVTSVWVADNKNRINAYNVKTGKAVGDRIEILSGLVKGDKIVIKPQDNFKNNDVIQETGVSQNLSGEEAMPEGDGHDHEH